MNTATKTAQALADEHGVDIQDINAGEDNRVGTREVKAYIKENAKPAKAKAKKSTSEKPVIYLGLGNSKDNIANRIRTFTKDNPNRVVIVQSQHVMESDNDNVEHIELPVAAFLRKNMKTVEGADIAINGKIHPDPKAVIAQLKSAHRV